LFVIAALVLVGCQDSGSSRPSDQGAQPQFDPQVVAAEEKMDVVKDGVQRYKQDVGEFPKTIDDLLASDAEGWKGPYVGTGTPVTADTPSYSQAELVTDPWGSRYQLDVDSDPSRLVSFGPDKTEGTEDDIVVTVSAAE
jgi:hypothetical protein